MRYVREFWRIVRKGLHFLIKALGTVRKSIPNVRLTVVGEANGAPRERCDELCRRMEVSENVAFVGFKIAAEIAELHRQSQVFVLASRWENSPNTVAEAMVTGMPPIATNVGGLSSMIEDGVNGLLVEHGWSSSPIVSCDC